MGLSFIIIFYTIFKSTLCLTVKASLAVSKMKYALLWISSLALAYCATHAPSTTMDPTEMRMKYLENSVETLARQTMLQQLFVDERTRSDGDSGKRTYEI